MAERSFKRQPILLYVSWKMPLRSRLSSRIFFVLKIHRFLSPLLIKCFLASIQILAKQIISTGLQGNDKFKFKILSREVLCLESSGKAIEVFLLKSLDAQSAPGMNYFSFKVQRCPILKVLNKDNFNGSVLWYFSRTIPRLKFEKE